MPYRPIFIVGCPRSGTTLLSTLLHAQPNIAMPPETRFLLPVYEQREQFGDLTQAANRRKVGEFITARSTYFSDLRLDRGKVIDAIVDAPPTLGSALGTVWSEFARDRGAKRWGEKRPMYWREMGVILRLFPRAQVIHLVRDPRAAIASLQQVSWYKGGVPEAAALWVQADKELRRAGRRLGPCSYHRLRFEDLMGEPRARLSALCEFLEEDFAEQMLDHVSAARDIVPDRKTWHSRVKGPLDSSRINAWQKVLSPADAGPIHQTRRRSAQADDPSPRR